MVEPLEGIVLGVFQTAGNLVRQTQQEYEACGLHKTYYNIVPLVGKEIHAAKRWHWVTTESAFPITVKLEHLNGFSLFNHSILCDVSCMDIPKLIPLYTD